QGDFRRRGLHRRTDLHRIIPGGFNRMTRLAREHAQCGTQQNTLYFSHGIRVPEAMFLDIGWVLEMVSELRLELCRCRAYRSAGFSYRPSVPRQATEDWRPLQKPLCPQPITAPATMAPAQ